MGLPFDSSSMGIDDRFRCSACRHLLVQAKFSRCAHRFCSDCLTEILGSKSSTTCCVQNCQQIIHRDEIYPDFPIENELRNLSDIACWNKPRGCTWKGLYSDYQNHFENCPFEQLQCRFCLLPFAHRSARDEHIRLCPKAMVPCPLNKLGCDVKTRREILSEHLSSSLVEHFQLLVSRSGVSPGHSTNNSSLENDLIKQTQLIEQLQLEKKSLHSTLKKCEQDLSQTRVDLQLLKGDFYELRKDLDITRSLTHQDGTFLWRIDNIQQLVRSAKTSSQPACLISPAFYTSPFGYKLALKVYLNGDKTVRNEYLSMYITVMRSENDSLLDWPFPYPITLCLYDRSVHRDHIVHTLTPDVNSECFARPRFDANKSGGIPQFCPLCKVFDKDFGYVRENSIFIKAFVDFDLHPANLWPQRTKLQSAGVPSHVEMIKMKKFSSQ